jgi:hypothetical protein
MDYVTLNKDGRYYCNICTSLGKSTSFAYANSIFQHKKTSHQVLKQHKTKIECSPKNQIHEVNTKVTAISEQMTTLVSEIKDLKQQIPNQLANNSNISNNNINNNNSTIYFNKDLKYYPELVKIMGKEKACNYLLYGMPETKDIFGVIDKLFFQNSNLGCPFRYDHDTGDFLIARAEGVFDRDPTGETIDRENKSKLQDAILSAYVDTTHTINKECADLRIARLNGEYTEADQEKLTRRFDALMTVEPIRPYEVIDVMNGLKPKKRDFDKIKKMCPEIVKKITIS